MNIDLIKAFNGSTIEIKFTQDEYNKLASILGRCDIPVKLFGITNKNKTLTLNKSVLKSYLIRQITARWKDPIKVRNLENDLQNYKAKYKKFMSIEPFGIISKGKPHDYFVEYYNMLNIPAEVFVHNKK